MKKDTFVAYGRRLDLEQLAEANRIYKETYRAERDAGNSKYGAKRIAVAKVQDEFEV